MVNRQLTGHMARTYIYCPGAMVWRWVLAYITLITLWFDHDLRAACLFPFIYLLLLVKASIFFKIKGRQKKKVILFACEKNLLSTIYIYYFILLSTFYTYELFCSFINLELLFPFIYLLSVTNVWVVPSSSQFL